MSTVFEFTYSDGPVIARVEAANEREARAHLRETITARKLPVSEVIALAQSGKAIMSAKTGAALGRSEEHTSELQSLMRISYAVFCLKNKIQSTHATLDIRR